MSTNKNTITRYKAEKRLNDAIRRSGLEIWQLRQILGLAFRLRTDQPTNFIDRLFLPSSVNGILQLIKKVEFYESR